MNLQRLKNIVAGMATCVAPVTFGQSCRRGVLSPRSMNPTSVRAGFLTATLIAVLLPLSLQAQTNYYNPNGTEYAVVGAQAGDQVFPDLAISSVGGFVVWQDNITDGDSWGISARRLDSTLSGVLGSFRVNANGAGSQENPRVALFKGGGAVFVWQGGKPSFQHIYARFVNASNTFTTGDVLVNTFSNNFQVNPAIAVLNNSNVVVVWSSWNQASSNSMRDVYAQILSPSGAKVGGEFLVNQTTAFNQRSPGVTALAGGGFVVTWVSEQQRVTAPSWGTNSTASLAVNLPAPSVDVYARVFNNAGTAAGGEFLANTDSNPCASPAVASDNSGGFLITWAASDRSNQTNSFDIYARTFSASGSALSSVVRVNTARYGDQYVPRVSSLGYEYLIIWTSLAQDGSREGVFGQFLHNNGARVGSEFRVNTTTTGQQMQPVVAADGANQFLAVWTSFTGMPNEFDLYAQRYISATALLQAMPAPFVWVPFVVSNNVYQPRLVVSWSPLAGIAVSNYEVYVDGSSVPTALVSSNQWTMTSANGLGTNSSRCFQVDYVTTDGRRAPISPSACGMTWSGLNWGGIPYEWMAANFGGYFNGQYNTTFWPQATVQAGPNMTVGQIFLSGGNPWDSSTWLNQTLARTPQGLFLNWNTAVGATYQVQVTTNLKVWNNVGTPRFAAGTNDSMYVGGSPVGYYRVQLMR